MKSEASGKNIIYQGKIHTIMPLSDLGSGFLSEGCLVSSSLVLCSTLADSLQAWLMSRMHVARLVATDCPAQNWATAILVAIGCC